MLSTLHTLSHLVLLVTTTTTWSSNLYPYYIDGKIENRQGADKLTKFPKVEQLKRGAAKIHTQSHPRAQAVNHYLVQAPKIGR